MAYVDTQEGTKSLAGEARVEDYFALLKPRVMSLVVFTALVGMLIAPGGLHPFVALVAILSIAIGAGASGALNMWYDSDVDAVMSRTANRPIPAGRMGREEALVFGVVLSVLSVATLGLATNWLAAGLLAFTIFFYAVIYTMWLKRATPQNIVIGGAAGAFPPAIGWAAVTGSVGIEAVAMFLIIFLWTPPHFWALALYKRGDYHAAGIPMLPNVAGDRATQIQIFIYSLVLFAVSLVPVITGFGGAIYGTVAVVSGLAFVVMAWRLLSATKDNLHRAARYLFTYSLSYLFVVFLALFTDRVFIMLGGF